MKLSALQKYILIECLTTSEKMLRGKFREYYQNKKNKPKLKDQNDIVNKSINKLIDKGLLVGFGRRTSEKWFFTFVKLTPKGKKKSMEIFKSKQQKLFK
jgi:hypothetical protein